MTSSRPVVSAAGALVCAVAIATAGSAAAKDNQTVWEGYATTTNATAGCAGVPATGKGSTRVSIFRPHIKATDTDTFLSMMLLRAGITFDNISEASVPQMHGAGNYTAHLINGRAKYISYQGTYKLTVTPAAISATSPIVRINGKLNRWLNTPGCNVTFKAIYVKRID